MATRARIRPSPVFLACVAVTAVGGGMAWSDASSSRVGNLGVFLFVLGGWVVSLCFHEFAHAYAAYRAGDTSTESAGYLSLNPFKYVHPLLSIILPLFFIIQGGIGLPGGAVYLHPGSFRSRASQSIAAAVGPLTNVVFAVALLTIAQSQATGDHLRFWAALGFLGFLQVTAAVLNLLPVPGLDGYAILEPHLAPANQRSFAPIKPWGMLAVIVLLQVRQINDVFFDVVLRIYDATGASRELYYLGYQFFRFWN